MKDQNLLRKSIRSILSEAYPIVSMSGFGGGEEPSQRPRPTPMDAGRKILTIARRNEDKFGPRLSRALLESDPVDVFTLMMVALDLDDGRFKDIKSAADVMMGPSVQDMLSRSRKRETEPAAQDTEEDVSDMPTGKKGQRLPSVSKIDL